MTQSKLYAVSGMSGAGKTTIMRDVLGMNAEIVSVTTRPMREGEIDGIDYYFLTEPQFKELMDQDALAEYTTYYERANYGVTKEEIYERIEEGDAYIIVDTKGMKQLKEIYGERCVSIYIYATKDDCFWNMFKRGDSQEQISDRLSTYELERNNLFHYDHIVRNGSEVIRLNQAKLQVLAITSKETF